MSLPSERMLNMKSPCDDCVVSIMCTAMCEEALPYYKSLATKDQTFDHDHYFHRVEKYWEDKASGVESPTSIRTEDSNIELHPKEKNDGKKRRTKVLRKIGHRCASYLKDKVLNKRRHLGNAECVEQRS